MQEIKITVRDKRAHGDDTNYICNNSDFIVVFDFDNEWDTFTTKTARFIYCNTYQEVVFSGNTCTFPVIEDAEIIKVGVYAGDLHTTTPAWIRARKSILSGSAVHADPPKDVYNQLMAALNDKITEPAEDGTAGQVLTTDGKGGRSWQTPQGGSGTSDHSKLSNRDAVDQHPIGAITGLQDELDAKQPSGNYLTSETDPTVPAWAKQATKPTYTAKEVGALPNTTVIPAKTSDLLNDSGFITGVSIQTISADESDDVIAHLNQGLYFFEPRPIQGIDINTGLATGTTASGLVSVDDEQGLTIYNAGCYAWYVTDTWNIENYFILNQVATPSVLGGVMPEAKTDDMSQTVGVDGEGRLWTAPGSGGSETWVKVCETTITEEVSTITQTFDKYYKKIWLYFMFIPTSACQLFVYPNVTSKPASTDRAQIFHFAYNGSMSGKQCVLIGEFDSAPKNFARVSDASPTDWRQSFYATGVDMNIELSSFSSSTKLTYSNYAPNIEQGVNGLHFLPSAGAFSAGTHLVVYGVE